MLAKILSEDLTYERADRLIEKWEAAEQIPLAVESTLAYRAQVEAGQRKIFKRRLYTLCNV